MMNILRILKNVAYKTDYNNLDTLEIKEITESSTNMKEGSLFIAIKGYETDGHAYIDDAIDKGAAAIIGQNDISNLPVPYIQVENSRKALANIASNFYDNPSCKKKMIGITGTNGKTTTSYLIKHILEESGKSCSLIGTIETIINGEKDNSINTTPGAFTINKLLDRSEDEFVIIEASSHGLSQYRLEGITFDICLFLNLSHEHLDYHDSMEEYFETKALLFKKLKENGLALVNTDNEWGKKLHVRLEQENIKTYSIGVEDNSNYRMMDINVLGNGSTKLEHKQATYTLDCPMKGIHNMYNACMAYATADQLSIEEETIIKALKNFPGVDGRFQIFSQSNGAKVIIDYAHTTDAFFNCLQTAKEEGAKRIIHIFGFRGNRDTSKRHAMLELTAGLSDQYLLTLDDLNAVPLEEMIETLEEIHDAIGNDKGVVIPDRTLAIQEAMQNSIAGDWIIITGKGHESYQQAFALPTMTDKETVEYLSQ
ncbi:UDP-N-acetylmuramoyl-L-alanyl-D-glutamate--2,6-diaminopimelate ligase [Paraliobacillus quinghaiensis]|uniref:UDP-N-acetylmuramyl-tripeptide synthetase n=1 Tax=Paraliobacillus quinghaiensis TaxID=470815 RepID=A0A917TII3_9BACI|nr:UDP-N-acetylmuramoyl-L-alanyl-D-glutamate--2,6-diaminopimelate ligase [Paraliobacillus quinghaiensis]GGM23977.1 UDP-N-acetylmuramoyl-L-alanyl-D-glutamate--2,6-diaminopimelate ligase [Paraliobacillus quinghaiensis]